MGQEKTKKSEIAKDNFFRRIWLIAPAILLLAGQSKAQVSLDDHYHTIKSYGSLTELCLARPHIKECKVAIGRWKPDELEKVKSLSPFCYQQCEHDQYGFIKSPESGQEYPMVVTKDFDGSSASRGVEFFLYPVAMTTYKYKGCTGCSLVKTYPSSVQIIKTGNQIIALPRLARGTFYMTTEARNHALSQPELKVRLNFNKDNEIRRISSKALSAYKEMLKSLHYDKIR